MRFARSLFAVTFLLLASLAAHADTVYFSATITKQYGLTDIPIGTTYSGYAHYAGTWDIHSTGYPPTIDAFAFNYPSTPSSLSSFMWVFLQRQLNHPLFVEFAYIDPAVPLASFTQDAVEFSIVVPTSVYPNNGGFGYSYYESGPVTFSYASDPVTTVGDPIAPTPEPSTLALLGSLLPAAAALGRRRLLSL